MNEKVFLATALLLLLFVAASPSSASDREIPPTAPPAYGDEARAAQESYWGPIPERADSVSARFEAARQPAWVRALDGTWQAATFPVDLLFRGVREAVIAADEHRVYSRYVMPVLQPRIGPVHGRFGLMAGGLSGTGISFTGVHPHFLGDGNPLQLGLRATDERNDKAVLGVRYTHGRAGSIEFGGGYRTKPNARYFGMGPRSAEAAESYFRLEVAWVGLSYDRLLPWGVGLGGEVLYSGVGAIRTSDEYFPLRDRFKGNLPFGYGKRSDGVAFSLSLEHDTADEERRPQRGGLRRFSAAYFESTDGTDGDHWTYRADVQQFFPLWHSKRTFALRGLLAWMDSAGEDPIPFQRLHSNEAPDLFRGFDDFRWRDEGIIAFSAEYRWPLWTRGGENGPGVDAYLLADAGQVFRETEEISEENMRGSYGFGFRIVSFDRFVGRVEFARSEEESVFRLRGEQVFQYAKGGLFHGKNPIPSR